MDGGPTSTTPRRRDKPQLSCNACRRRKVRCDRLHPCSNCSSRGLGLSCVYQASQPAPVDMSANHVRGIAENESHATNPGMPINMQSRINQLESLVLDLMHHNSSTPSATQRQERQPTAQPQHSHTPIDSEPLCDVSPSPSDYGTISIRRAHLSYVGSSHWVAVLDSITELRNYFAQEEDAQHQAVDPVVPQTSLPKPQLFYSYLMYESRGSILKSMPARAVVDRLVSRYFNVLDIAPGVVHSAQFLREYDEFWKRPEDSPIIWVGMLFSMMCLSAQLQRASLGNSDSGHPQSWRQLQGPEDPVDTYKTKAIQCLLSGRYTMGGPYAVETLILYFLIECFDLKDMEIGVWVLAGTIVQIATYMGYHRDAKHFPDISPFSGEMRRRVWAMVLQLDFSISTQLGLPRSVKESQTDTAEPRNLYDSDFHEDCMELPPSRPETEVTPTLYVLAKLRLLSLGGKVADVATEPRTYSYTHVLDLDAQIKEAQASLPFSLKWNGLGMSLNVSSQIIVQQVFLEVLVQQLNIVLHKRFIDPSRLHPHCRSSRIVCIDAAMKILNLQCLVDEETQADGLLYPSRWRVSSAFSTNFLLATSILCYCVHTENVAHCQDNSQEVGIESAELEKAHQLLKTSQSIWGRQCANSKEAQKAFAAIRYVLGDIGVQDNLSNSEERPTAVAVPPASYFPEFTTNYDLMNLDFGPGHDAGGWPFAPNVNGDTEQWARQINGSFMR